MIVSELNNTTASNMKLSHSVTVKSEEKNLSHISRGALLFLGEMFIIALLAIMAGYNILFETTDSVEYAAYYDSISENETLGLNGYEPLFNFTASAAKLILGLEYNAFASILVFIALLIKFALFSRRPNSFALKLAYICSLYLVLECLTIRAALAISLGYLALELRHLKFRSWILMTLSCLMHYSLVCFIPILLLYKTLENREKLSKNIMLYTGAIVILIPISISLLIPYNDRFANHIINNPEYFNIWGLPKMVILFSLIYYTYRNRAHLDKNSCFLLNTLTIITLISAVTFKLSMFSIRIMDIGILAAYLIVNGEKFTNRLLGNALFSLIIIEQLFMRTFDMPQIILKIIKS